MSVSQILSTVILVSFIVTLVLAVGSYFAYKARERRRPSSATSEGGAPVYFERVYPAGPARAGGLDRVEVERGR